MTRIIKTMTSILLLIGMVTFAIPIHANETFGSITIILEDTTNQLSKENVEFGLVKVADVMQGEYVSLEEYKYFDFNSIETSVELKNTASKLKHIISKNDYTGSTDHEGILRFEELSVGVYLLYPIDIADYEIIEPTLVSIPTWNEIDSEMQCDIFVFPKHESLPVIQIRKVDSKTNNPIKNRAFEFTLYSDSNCMNVIEKISEDNNDGIIQFDITYGTYYLKETDAPDGYLLSKDVIKIEFNEEGVFINDKLIEKENNVYSLDFENSTKSTSTPSTSDEFNIIIWQCMIAFSLILLSILIVLKEESNEKK